MARYYIEQPPTQERAADVRRLADREAERVAKIVGMSAWYEHAERVLSADEYAMMCRSWKDDRNPGTVTMTALFIQFCRHADDPPQRCHYCRTGIGSSCSCV